MQNISEQLLDTESGENMMNVLSKDKWDQISTFKTETRIWEVEEG